MVSEYTPEDVGCYADGSLGHNHCREVLLELIEPHNPDSDLRAALKADMSDDAWEEDAALEILNDHCHKNVLWTFEEGDLVLMDIGTDDIHRHG